MSGQHTPGPWAASGEPFSEQKRVAKLYERNLGLDWQKLIAEAAKPGPIDSIKPIKATGAP